MAVTDLFKFYNIMHKILQLLHRLVDGTCHRPRPSYDEFSKVWSLQDWWTLTDVYTDLFKEAVKNTWTKDMVWHHNYNV